MPFNIEIDTSTKVTTAGGTLLTFLGNIQTEDIIKTVVLSIIGAIVSFCVSMWLKWLVRRLKD
jgi:hypothetical protein